MYLHDCIVEEFEQTKSLAALIYLIEQGREIEFLFEGEKLLFIPQQSPKKEYPYGATRAQRNRALTVRRTD